MWLVFVSGRWIRTEIPMRWTSFGCSYWRNRSTELRWFSKFNHSPENRGKKVSQCRFIEISTQYQQTQKKNRIPIQTSNIRFNQQLKLISVFSGVWIRHICCCAVVYLWGWCKNLIMYWQAKEKNSKYTENPRYSSWWLIDSDQRYIHLFWKVECVLNDVCVYESFFYASFFLLVDRIFRWIVYVIRRIVGRRVISSILTSTPRSMIEKLISSNSEQ